ncbi:hypothetical protein CAPTEDRAFT_202997 [Capitella teleta]|uniref:Uncharacterized protein n=1 Tax=Capitella teleta TaxID=283909 RepID=R7TUG1_CAPTE|nr:hypothetical protein CAPTEDRAFT_202997 [Capitella teleta]|eukprot:ELT95111.1 hypothetical protein CAPTEDRAFT_202997 [Capitella teleta]
MDEDNDSSDVHSFDLLAPISTQGGHGSEMTADSNRSLSINNTMLSRSPDQLMTKTDIIEIEISNDPGEQEIAPGKQWSNSNYFLKQILPCDPTGTFDVIEIQATEHSDNSTFPADEVSSYNQGLDSPINNILSDLGDLDEQSFDTICGGHLSTSPVNCPGHKRRASGEPYEARKQSCNSSFSSIYGSYEESEKDIFGDSYPEADHSPADADDVTHTPLIQHSFFTQESRHEGRNCGCEKQPQSASTRAYNRQYNGTYN